MTHLQIATDSALVMVLLLDLGLLAAGRLKTGIRLFSLQCLVVAALPLAAEMLHGELPTLHGFVLLAGTIALKSWFIPWLLLRTIRTIDIHKDIEPLIGFTASVVVGAIIVLSSFGIAARLPLPGVPVSDILVPVAMSTLLIGLLILVSRAKAITQVLGFLVFENGIFLFGLTLVRKMPLLVEVGMLLDLFVGVFVMAIVVYHIRRAFDHVDTNRLPVVRDN